MQTLIQPEVKLKIASFDNSTNKVKEKSNNLKSSLDIKFYQKLFLLLLSSCAFLIFPESPKTNEVLCEKYQSIQACIVW
tara:strand:- start:1297 stop:1533 length:237 start_codon:yes stop_codon:yes gene_type:complete